MSTATLPATWTIRYDAASEGYPWLVLDADGDTDDCFTTEAEALVAVAELVGAAAEEAADEARDELVGEISDRLADLDAATLTKILALIERA